MDAPLGKRDKGAWGDKPPPAADAAWAFAGGAVRALGGEASATQEHQQSCSFGNAGYRQSLHRGVSG